jgi:membrane protease YdiL (CAAX protease family)
MTLIYGFILGFMRQKTKGFFLPYFVHIFADLTVGYLLLFYAK